jgi:hypothetical protein
VEFCGEGVGFLALITEMKRKNETNQLPKVRVKVPKQVFDKIFGEAD